MEYLKDKIAMIILKRHINLKYELKIYYSYCVSIVELNAATIKIYKIKWIK